METNSPEQQRRRRSRRTKSDRTPAVYRTRGIGQSEQTVVQHGVSGRSFSWRAVSALIVTALMIVLFMLFTADVFYVRSIGVSGLKYLRVEDVFRRTGVADIHVFWIDPEDVRESLLEWQVIADAQVVVDWPPQMVRVTITEREPAVIWEQDGIPAWVDIHGNVLMSPPVERPDLLQIVTQNIDQAISINDKIPVDVIAGALQLRELMPETAILRYDPIKGLGFVAESGAFVWFGSGRDMAMKILIYEALKRELDAQGVVPGEVNLVNPDAPFYCERLSGCE